MLDPIVLAIAMVCHEVNKAYCEALGDMSQPTWDDAPQWQKDSAIAGVGYHMEHPEALPSDSHASWLKQKEQEGWKYGPVTDVEKKEHPCYVPYRELPIGQRAKDFLFKATVHATARALDFVFEVAQ